MSGPAGGVTGALWISEKVGYKNLLTLDMGGTSADVALIEGGVPKRRCVCVGVGRSVCASLRRLVGGLAVWGWLSGWAGGCGASALGGPLGTHARTDSTSGTVPVSWGVWCGRKETRVGNVSVRAQALDVHTVGAGGGSIAHVPQLTQYVLPPPPPALTHRPTNAPFATAE
jgi:N-methylhydantoinase A/oxoprolinase/acetone carboxylase beta subunit